MDSLIKDIALTVCLPVLNWVREKVIPRIIYYFSKEPKIEGEWETLFNESGTSYRETVELKQIGKSVKGKIKLLSSDPNVQRSYAFKGSFKQRILTCTYYSNAPEDYEEGAFVLEYRSDRSFSGEYILFAKNSTSKSIFSTRYEWKK